MKKRYSHLLSHAFLVSLLRRITRISLKKIFGIYTTDTFVEYFPPPYILLLQHSSAWDPIVYHSFINTPIHYVVSDAHFRKPFMRFILGLIGSIVKKKSTSDIRTAMEMLYVLKKLKESVGIFPEGVNTWDGASLPIVESTAKLILHAKVPVICGVSHGAYSTFPRWAKNIRRGSWKVQFSVCLTKKQIKTMNEKEIFARISDVLKTNEYTQQKKNPIVFKSKNRAQYIERVIYACPICEGLQCIESKKSYFTCTNCCSLWNINSYGFFFLRKNVNNTAVVNTQKNTFSTLQEWNNWQHTFLQHLTTAMQNADKNNHKTIFHDTQMTLLYGTRRPVITCGTGSITLSTTQFIFTPNNDKRHKIKTFPIKHIQSINVQNNEKLEWTTHKGLTYQLKSKQACGNTYKYMCAINIILKKLNHLN